MFLLIDNVKIENRFVRILEDYPDGFLLAGEAVEEDGKEIHDGLKRYKKGIIVQIEDYLEGKYMGIWEIAEIDLQLDAQSAPKVYKFRIVFQPITR
jgi:hypothetical protein